jgi:hypothetical protein
MQLVSFFSFPLLESSLEAWEAFSYFFLFFRMRDLRLLIGDAHV